MERLLRLLVYVPANICKLSIFAGVWLLIIGEWRLVLAGFAIAIIGRYFLALVFMLFNFLLVEPTAKLMEKGIGPLGILMTLLSSIVSHLTIYFWCVSILYFAILLAQTTSFLPIFIWLYGASLYPLFSVLNFTPTNESMGSLFISLSSAIGLLVLYCISYFSNLSSDLAFKLFFWIMMVGALAQTAYTINEQIKIKRLEDIFTGK